MEAPSPPAELPIMPHIVRGVNQGVKAAPDGKPGPLEPAVEEDESLPDIEMPPPMEIQDHTFKTDTKDVSTDDVTAQLVGGGSTELWERWGGGGGGLEDGESSERETERQRQTNRQTDIKDVSTDDVTALLVGGATFI